jgi:hypothetical protein
MKNSQDRSNNSNDNKNYKKKKQDDIDFTNFSANLSKVRSESKFQVVKLG